MPTITKYRNGVPNWAELATTDVPVAVAFYCDLFGWSAENQGGGAGGYHEFSIDGAAVAGLGPRRDAGSVPLWSTYLAVDDIDATLVRAQQAGATSVMPRTDIQTAGSMATVTDPSGAHVSFWQASDHIGAELVNEDNTVVWNELTTRDAAAAMEFYRDVIGCDFVPMDAHAPSGYQLMSVGGRVVAGLMPMDGDDWGDMASHWMTYFATADTEATAARVRELGGSVSVEPFDTPVGRIAVVNDPTGNAFSIIHSERVVDPIDGGVA